MKRARTPAEIRARAAEIVIEVAEQGRSLDTLLEAGSAANSERALLRLLSYGTIRWFLRLRALLQLLTGKPIEQLSPPVRAIALVGLYQLIYTDIADHAAVAETVNAAKVLGQSRASGLVNAVLRRFQREGQELLAEVDADVAAATSHPSWLIEQLQQDWPQDVEKILAANNAHPPLWLRANRLRTSRDAYLQQLADANISATAGRGAESIQILTPVDVRMLPGFADGLVSVQDVNAQLAAHLLGSQPHDRVLDACAAPGGKTCHILELQPEIEELLALDNSAIRLERVDENLQRLKLQAELVTADAATPQAWWDGKPFQRILLDVPCSGTGVIRRHPDIKLLRRAADIPALARRQNEMLENLWPLLAPQGRLLYASCSALRAENAAVIEQFLAKHDDATEDTLAQLERVGFVTAATRCGPGYALPAGEAAGDGFYYACLQKIDG